MSSLVAYRCRTLWTMEEQNPFIDDGMVVVKDGIVIDVGRSSELSEIYPSYIVEDKGEVSLAPALINIHTHLELSHLHKKTRLKKGFSKWIKSLIPWLVVPITKQKLKKVLNKMKSYGICAVGDIVSRSASKVYESLKEEKINYCIFVEFLGRKKDIIFPKGIDPLSDKYVSISAHAPYSTEKKLIIKCKKWAKAYNKTFVIHVAESEEEVEFLTTGKGEFRFIMAPLLGKNMSIPGLHPVDYLDSLGVLDKDTLAIHCVHINKKHIETLKEKGCYVCICPRSNYFIGVGRAPWEDMYKAGIPLCLATDGLCSNEDLNLWNELEFLINTSKIELSLYEYLKMVTTNPANISKLNKLIGTISVGKKAVFSYIPSKIEKLFKPKGYV